MNLSRRDFLKIASIGLAAGYAGGAVNRVLTDFNIDPVGKAVDEIKARVDKLDNVEIMVVPLKDDEFIKLKTADYNAPLSLYPFEMGRGIVTNVGNGEMTLRVYHPDYTYQEAKYDLTGDDFTSRMMREAIAKEARYVYFWGSNVTYDSGETGFEYYLGMNGATADGGNVYEDINIRGVSLAMVFTDRSGNDYILTAMKNDATPTDILMTKALHPGTEIILKGE